MPIALKPKKNDFQGTSAGAGGAVRLHGGKIDIHQAVIAG